MVPADVSITHLTFSKEFTKAIESKQVAEQEAERQLYVVQRADQERKVRWLTSCWTLNICRPPFITALAD
jgi:hypothetical protein